MQAVDFVYDAAVKRLYDGDSLFLDIDLGFGVWILNREIRLIGIDAPEINTSSGIQALDYLGTLVKVGDPITLESIKDKPDKYGGRWLGRVWFGPNSTRCLNDAMLKSGHAVPWDGTGPHPNHP